MEPVLGLILIVLTPTINPGDPIQIEVFISGYGNITSNKFQLQYSSELVNQLDPGYIRFAIGEVTLENGTKKPVTGEGYFKISNGTAEKKLGIEGMIGSLVDAYFGEDPHEKGDFEIPTMIGEWRWDGHPPILININTATDISGDFNIAFYLTYTDDEVMKIDKGTITIHVRNKLERYGLWIALMSVIVAIFAIPKAADFSNFIWEIIVKLFTFLKNKIN